MEERTSNLSQSRVCIFCFVPFLDYLSWSCLFYSVVILNFKMLHLCATSLLIRFLRTRRTKNKVSGFYYCDFVLFSRIYWCNLWHLMGKRHLGENLTLIHQNIRCWDYSPSVPTFGAWSSLGSSMSFNRILSDVTLYTFIHSFTEWSRNVWTVGQHKKNLVLVFCRKVLSLIVTEFGNGYTG